ncbi:MAG: hypothetical protein AB1894_12650 [Chloroflexota bacterium]
MDASFVQKEDERLRILRMVEEGKVTASEGISLLEALSKERPAPKREAEVPIADEVKENIPVREVTAGHAPRWFKVRVTDLATGKAKTSVTMPIGLVDWGLKIGARYAPEADIDLQEVSNLLRMGVEGKLIDVLDEEDGEHVEIYVE